MSDQKDDLEKFNSLTLKGEVGQFRITMKKGFPRITFFHKNEDGFISAPMRVRNLIGIAHCLRVVANSKDDIKYVIPCKNIDYETKEKMIQSVIIVARKGDDVMFAIKRSLEDKAYVYSFKDEWVPIYKNDSTIDCSAEVNAIAYADMIFLNAKEMENIAEAADEKRLMEYRDSKKKDSKPAPTTGDNGGYQNMDDDL